MPLIHGDGLRGQNHPKMADFGLPFHVLALRSNAEAWEWHQNPVKHPINIPYFFNENMDINWKVLIAYGIDILVFVAIVVFLAQFLDILGIRTAFLMPYIFICLLFAISFLVAPSVQKRFFD